MSYKVKYSERVFLSLNIIHSEIINEFADTYPVIYDFTLS